MESINNSQSVTNSTSTNSSQDETSSIDLSSSSSSIESSYGSSISLLSEITGSDSTGSINEEQLFASLIYDRIKSSKGEAAAEEYKALLLEALANNTTDGYTYVEKSAGEALSQMVDAGYLTTEEAEIINSQAFQSAQLDDNLNELWDSQGDTVSTSSVSSASESSIAKLLLFDNGEIESGRRELSSSSKSSGVSGSTSGTSNSDDSSYANSAEYDTLGLANGDRESFRINGDGPSYGSSMKVVFEDGYTVTIDDLSSCLYLEDGFIYKPGMGEMGSGPGYTGTSHNGIFFHAPYGNESDSVTIYWN
ncbi:MAG: hypothetical protein A2Y40_06725 [Candidatus Margulisbacteria bacterium GWF2_35_9]|nr:MAG: hypothetical protein A2Y40_06725 [Candidatus Margulisbacteria bacterium GWF2_35_9]